MATDKPDGGMVEDIAFLKSSVEELTAANAALVERVAALEGATPPDTAAIVEAVQNVHIQLFGVPVGALQKLRD